jgi:hypothetical protein
VRITADPLAPYPETEVCPGGEHYITVVLSYEYAFQQPIFTGCLEYTYYKELFHWHVSLTVSRFLGSFSI